MYFFLDVVKSVSLCRFNLCVNQREGVSVNVDLREYRGYPMCAYGVGYVFVFFMICRFGDFR